MPCSTRLASLPVGEIERRGMKTYIIEFRSRKYKPTKWNQWDEFGSLPTKKHMEETRKEWKRYQFRLVRVTTTREVVK